MAILIVRKLFLIHMTYHSSLMHAQPHQEAQDDNNGRNFSTTRPMRTRSGVLESPRSPLSIGGIMSLFRRLLFNRSGQKWGWGKPQTASKSAPDPILHKICQNNQIWQYDHQSKALFNPYRLVPLLRTISKYQKCINTARAGALAKYRFRDQPYLRQLVRLKSKRCAEDRNANQ